jgi:RNA polymerase sigma-70 factor, ECF subfamily
MQPRADTNASGTPANHAADRDLVRAVVAGDEPATALFVRRMQCVPRFLSVLNARGALDSQESGDLVQSVLASVWRRLPDFAGHSTLESWVYPFCVHELMNAYRRRRRRPSRSDDVPEPPAPPIPDPAWFHEDVHAALERLGAEEADIIRKKHFDELTFEEIARRLDISANTAKTRYYRALVKLRAMLKPDAREGSA